MIQQRRDLIKLGVLQALTWGLESSAHSKEVVRRQGPSILQGASDESSAQFSIVHNKELNFFTQVTSNQGQVWSPVKKELISFPFDHRAVTKVYFNHLFEGEQLNLNLIDERTGLIVDSRLFKTLAIKENKLRFAVCSCMDDRRHDAEIWQELVARNPDIIFFIGDSVYTDKGISDIGVAKPETLWRRFCEARTTLDIYYSKYLIPIVATWDDHDFGANDADSSYPYVVESQSNFRTFFAQEPDYCRYLMSGFGVGCSIELAGQLFVLLDDRSFRLQKGSQDPYAHWGREQTKWLYELLQKQSGPSWLLNGSQFFPKVFWRESLSRDHQGQLQQLITELSRVSSKVLFVSGDVHYSEISRIEPEVLGYQTYEFTSSSVHSRHFPGAPGIIPNPRRIKSTGNNNFMLFESQAEDNGARVVVKSCSRRGQVNFVESVKI